MDLVDKVSKRIEDLIRQNSAFQEACDRCFLEADKNDDGKITPEELVSKTGIIFEEMEDVLKSASIEVVIPSEDKVMELLKLADLDKDNSLNEKEFALFFEQILKLAAVNAARSFFAKNGAGILAAATSAVALYTGQEQLAINAGIKQIMQVATPFVSVAIGAMAKMRVSNAGETKLESRLFRAEAFKKEN
eukprot:g311.t1